MKTTSVKDFIIASMKEKGYDALCNQDADNCGCSIDDLAPCGEDPLGCSMAYKHECKYNPEKCLECCEGKEKPEPYCVRLDKPAQNEEAPNGN